MTDNELVRYNQNGFREHVLYKNSSVQIVQLTVDYYEKNIYWLEVDNTKKVQIRFVNLNGTVPKIFEVKGNTIGNYSWNHLAVDQKYVYYVLSTNDGYGHLYRARKVDGAFDEDFEIAESFDRFENKSSRFQNIMVGSGQEIADYHPCKQENGGCKYFCVAVHDESKKLAKRCINKRRPTGQSKENCKSMFCKLFFELS